MLAVCKVVNGIIGNCFQVESIEDGIVSILEMVCQNGIEIDSEDVEILKNDYIVQFGDCDNDMSYQLIEIENS